MQKTHINKNLILIIVCMLLTSLSFYYHFQKLKNINYQINWPKIELPSTESLLGQDGKNCKNFVSTDKRLTFNYCSDWLVTDANSLGGLFDQLNKDADAKIVFLAQKIITEKNAIIQLTIREAYWDLGNNFNEVIQKIKDSSKTDEEMQIVKSEMNENSAYFEAIYNNTEGEGKYSIGKIFFNGSQKYFLIEFFSQEKDKETLKIEVDKILKSIEFSS